ncbi:MAG TPA: histidine phosphatase family protein, partial [Limnochordia bacterium]|nr:histidine phosphatase family protein [Limnochordia bacterium]
MILYVVRHGQPLGHDGSPASQNPGLSPVGTRQAQRAAEQVAKWGIDALVSSAHQRAIETALPLRG